MTLGLLRVLQENNFKIVFEVVFFSKIALLHFTRYYQSISHFFVIFLIIAYCFLVSFLFIESNFLRARRIENFFL